MTAALEKSWPAAQKPEMWAIKDIQDYPNNPNIHTDEQIDLIALSMREEGVTVPCLVDEDGILIYGHGRKKAAIKNGFKRYPVLIARGWTEEQKRKVRVADNALASMSRFDPKLLSGELTVLADAGVNLPTLGFDVAQLAELGFNVKDADMPTLNDGDRQPFQQMTFTLHDKQAERVKLAMEIAKQAGEFDGPNENSNGNALARICEAYIGRAKADQAGTDRPHGSKRAGQKTALQRSRRRK